MRNQVVFEVIDALNAPKLTEQEEEMLKNYHASHRDIVMAIIGSLPHCGVLVRFINRSGELYSVIDYGDGHTGYSQVKPIQNATEEDEIELIRKWIDEEYVAFLLKSKRESNDASGGADDPPDETYKKEERSSGVHNDIYAGQSHCGGGGVCRGWCCILAF